jgi:hypothetical protein
MEMQFDESMAYLDKETGQVEIVTRQVLSLAEEADEDDSGDDLPNGSNASTRSPNWSCR